MTEIASAQNTLRDLSLALGAIGNCGFNALIDPSGTVVWSCFPRPDGDPVFCALIDGEKNALDRQGLFAIELVDAVRTKQHYVENTAVLCTELWDAHGNSLRITDFAPRFVLRERIFRPLMLVRRIEPVGRPRIRVRLRPRFDYGATAPVVTRGSNHVRYANSGLALRVTTDMPITYLLDETEFIADRGMHFLFGVDEIPSGGIASTARDFEESTILYWRHWVRPLGVPFRWQEAVIRAAITLKLCTFEETGAIVAAMTTSISEAPATERNWDYRFCWLRDAFFVVRALNSLSEVATMENYLGYLFNLFQRAEGSGHLQPVYRVGLEAELTERVVDTLAGYRGQRPVRVGNDAYRHLQHDVYGNVILAASQAFFDTRLLRRADVEDFHRLQWVGERAFALHDQPDAGMWEFRTRARVHTASSLMCWAACDRLARIAGHFELPERMWYWSGRAERIRARILEEAWNPKRNAFVDALGGTELDAGVLLMGEVGFLDPRDPRWISTVEAIGRELRNDKHIFRYRTPDDFGAPPSPTRSRRSNVHEWPGRTFQPATQRRDIPKGCGPMTATLDTATLTWQDVCAFDDLVPDRGA
ncbi:MAG: glycoside hydrolase family 15 protein, partial [Burkholderiales bacterium]